MPRRRDVLRAAGTTAAGGLATALAGCTARSSGGDGEGRFGRWLYDPATYGSEWQGYQVSYIEPATFASNETYLNRSMRDWLDDSGWSWRDRIDYQLQGGVVDGGSVFPSVAVYEGAFGIGRARSLVSEGATRVGAHDGRALYRAESSGYVALDHGEIWYVSDLDRPEAEAYFDRAGEHSFVADDDRFAHFFDHVGVGAYTELRLAGQDTGLAGFSYHVDGPTTTGRSLRQQPLTEAQREAIRRRVERARGANDGVRDATFEYDDGEARLTVELDTRRAVVYRDPLGVFAPNY